MLSAIHVMGDYWSDGADERSILGALVTAAKDQGAAEALDELCARIGAFARTLDLPDTATIVAVPPAPDRDAHPVPALAQAVAAALGAETAPTVTRRRSTPRLRDTPPDRRAAVVEAAGYEVIDTVEARRIVLVDDVVLTGTTLTHIARLLVSAGASRVDAIVAARTRQRR